MRKQRPQFWEAAMSREELTRLADYNGERSRGIVHSDEYRQRMAALQERFDTARMAHHGGLSR